MARLAARSNSSSMANSSSSSSSCSDQHQPTANISVESTTDPKPPEQPSAPPSSLQHQQQAPLLSNPSKPSTPTVPKVLHSKKTFINPLPPFLYHKGGVLDGSHLGRVGHKLQSPPPPPPPPCSRKLLVGMNGDEFIRPSLFPKFLLFSDQTLLIGRTRASSSSFRWYCAVCNRVPASTHMSGSTMISFE